MRNSDPLAIANHRPISIASLWVLHIRYILSLPAVLTPHSKPCFTTYTSSFIPVSFLFLLWLRARVHKTDIFCKLWVVFVSIDLHSSKPCFSVQFVDTYSIHSFPPPSRRTQQIQGFQRCGAGVCPLKAGIPIPSGQILPTWLMAA